MKKWWRKWALRVALKLINEQVEKEDDEDKAEWWSIAADAVNELAENPDGPST